MSLTSSISKQSGVASHNKILPFRFNGTGKEFFGIWIVNLLLSIITLGIYSAWAKVRTKRYFNGNTELDGHAFDYHAEPIAILKGRIIVVLVLIALNLLSQINVFLALAILVFYGIAIPWVIIRGLRFNANMTSYRNVRFHFVGGKWDAFKAYILWPIGAVLSFGVLYPFVSKANVNFLGGGHSYGQSPFSTDVRVKPFYRALGIALAIGLIPLIISFIYFGYIATWNSNSSDGSVSSIVIGLKEVFAFIALAFAYLGFIVAAQAYIALARNAAFASLKLEEGHQFSSTISVKDYAWIVLSNAVLTIITLGMFIPWAKVRIARYLADNTYMLAASDLNEFASRQTDDSGVASGEFLDIEGIDFGF